jgi:hypothetical protein
VGNAGLSRRHQIVASDFLPHGGTYFDDQRESDTKAWQRKRSLLAPQGVGDELIPLFAELRNRPHAKVSVNNEVVATGLRGTFFVWRRDGFMPKTPEVVVNPNVPATSVVVT